VLNRLMSYESPIPITELQKSVVILYSDEVYMEFYNSQLSRDIVLTIFNELVDPGKEYLSKLGKYIVEYQLMEPVHSYRILRSFVDSASQLVTILYFMCFPKMRKEIINIEFGKMVKHKISLFIIGTDIGIPDVSHWYFMLGGKTMFDFRKEGSMQGDPDLIYKDKPLQYFSNSLPLASKAYFDKYNFTAQKRLKEVIIGEGGGKHLTKRSVFIEVVEKSKEVRKNAELELNQTVENIFYDSSVSTGHKTKAQKLMNQIIHDKKTHEYAEYLIKHHKK
jgi:hypothetical protein